MRCNAGFAGKGAQPSCRYFTDCGGCQYQHISYAAQLRLKHKQICDLFARIGGLDPGVVLPVVPCPQPYGYRNRIMVRSQWDKFRQALNIGFIRADNRLVVDIEECKIAEPALNEQIREVRAHPPPKGGIKVVLRIAAEGWEVPRDSFFQNNFFLLPKLVEERPVNACVSGGARAPVGSVYCGVGFFGSMKLGDLVEEFVGVELDRLAVKAARLNAAARNRENGEFLAGPVEELLPGLLERFSASDTSVILDPPRVGCLPETLALLSRTRPRQIIYVSCHPATMARDLNIMCSQGVYDLKYSSPVGHVSANGTHRMCCGFKAEDRQYFSLNGPSNLSILSCQAGRDAFNFGIQWNN